MAVRAQGVVKFFNTKKQFGFCTREGEADVFVHLNALKRSGIEHVDQGDCLEFDVIEVEGKGFKAENIKRVDGGG